jgi:Uri superfamily endonuclease
VEISTDLDFPPVGGSYALFIYLDAAHNLTIGRLGEFLFPAGLYVYFGSAHGAGGLRARLNHHLGVSRNPRWHIDYLRKVGEIDGIWYVIGAKGLECAWSSRISQIDGVRSIVARFGASDCRNGCEAHCWWLGAEKGILEDLLRIE